jgi:hypothetical protein
MTELERLELVLRRMVAAKSYRADIQELLLDLIEALSVTSSLTSQERHND